jgi:hypothetical protein
MGNHDSYSDKVQRGESKLNLWTPQLVTAVSLSALDPKIRADRTCA